MTRPLSFGVGDNLSQLYSHTPDGSTAPSTALCIRPLKQTSSVVKLVAGLWIKKNSTQRGKANVEFNAQLIVSSKPHIGTSLVYILIAC